MLLEYYRGKMLLDGAAIDHREKCQMISLNHQEYTYRTNATIRNNESQYIKIDKTKITINTSWFGESPLFYFKKNGYFLISSSFADLLYKLREKHLDGLDFDRTGILESMIFDNPLRSRTLFKGINKILPGKQIIVDVNTLEISVKTLFILPFDKGCAPSNKFFVKEATDIIESIFNKLACLSGEVLLPLSGGLDSRLIACLLKKNNIPYNAITFGPKESTEPYIAKIVAHKLDIPFCYLELKDEYYKKYGDEVIWLTGGLSSHMHCHLYAILAANQIKYDNIIHGYLGGEYAGGSQPEHANNYSMSKGEALNKYITKYAERAWLWRKIATEDRENIIGDLDKIMKENCQCNLPCHFDEYIHNVDRQFSLIANVFSPIEAFGLVHRPLANKEYAVFFNSLPYELRAGRRLFIEASKSLFPEIFKIGTQSQIYNAHSLLGQIEKRASSLISKISYASLLLTKGKIVLRNPKAFERHRELLQTKLNKNLTDAILKTSDLLGINMSRLSLNSVVNRFQITSQYRILSLYSFLNCLEENKINTTGRCT